MHPGPGHRRTGRRIPRHGPAARRRARAPRAPGGRPGPVPPLPLRRAGAPAPGRPRAAGRLRAVLAGRRREQRARAGRERGAPSAAAGQHPEDAVRPHRAAETAQRDAAHRALPGARRRRRGQQPGRGGGGPPLPGGGPVAGGLPQLGQRRGARAGLPERRLGDHRQADADQRARPGRPGHPCAVPGRLRRPGPGVLRLRPRGLRPGGPAQPRLRAVLLHRPGGVPGRRVPVRHREHQPAAHRRGRRGAVPGSDRHQERLHQQRGQHARGRRPPGRPHP